MLERFLAACPDPAPDRIAVAVSGGGDSMALLHIALRAAAHLGWQVSAVTVDHGLRPESAAEAAGVAAYCAARGVAHATLRWQGPDPQGNLMDQARRARYRLMGDWAKAQGIAHVLLGHTADDDAEGFVMNLARSAGLDGLSGMRRDWQEGGVFWHRPLLQLSRAGLRAYLRRNALTWVDDPSNDNPRFARVRARQAIRALAPLGITVETVTSTLSNLADARQAMVRVTAAVARDITEQAGALSLPADAFAALDHEVARRLLGAVIQWMGGAEYGPRGAQVSALQGKLAEQGGAQLGGVRFLLRQGRLHMLREPRAVQSPLPFGQIWDHRWHVTGPALPGLEIGALGVGGLAQCPHWREHGLRQALVVTPAVWSGATLIAAPLAGLPGPFRAELSQGLAEFILSH